MNSGCRLTFVPAERAERLIRVFASGGQVHGVSVCLSTCRRKSARSRRVIWAFFLIYSVLSLLF